MRGEERLEPLAYISGEPDTVYAVCGARRRYIGDADGETLNRPPCKEVTDVRSRVRRELPSSELLKKIERLD
jgi:hypothetical protein